MKIQMRVSSKGREHIVSIKVVSKNLLKSVPVPMYNIHIKFQFTYIISVNFDPLAKRIQMRVSSEGKDHIVSVYVIPGWAGSSYIPI